MKHSIYYIPIGLALPHPASPCLRPPLTGLTLPPLHCLAFPYLRSPPNISPLLSGLVLSCLHRLALPCLIWPCLLYLTCPAFLVLSSFVPVVPLFLYFLSVPWFWAHLYLVNKGVPVFTCPCLDRIISYSLDIGLIRNH